MCTLKRPLCPKAPIKGDFVGQPCWKMQYFDVLIKIHKSSFNNLGKHESNLINTSFKIYCFFSENV